MHQLVARLASLAVVAAQTSDSPGPTYALAAAIAALASALGLVGKWMMTEITRLNSKLLDTAVPAMQASTIATNNMVAVAQRLAERLGEESRERARLEMELEQVQRRRQHRHPEGE